MHNLYSLINTYFLRYNVYKDVTSKYAKFTHIYKFVMSQVRKLLSPAFYTYI